VEIPLPAIVYEEGLMGLAALLGLANNSETVNIDFARASRYSPGAIVLLRSKIEKWLADGKKISISNYQECSGFKYLQRIDFFINLGLDLREDFERQNSQGRFVPLISIGRGGRDDTTELSTEIAECMAPGLSESYDPDEYGFYDTIEYSVSEMLRNVIQHSGGSGFACAQYYQQSDLVRIAIGDTGIGILNSFQQSASPHCFAGMNDQDAIHLALKPEVSSKTHLTGMWGEVVNAGVGLSLINNLAKRLDGFFIILSGDAFYALQGYKHLNPELGYNGTLCTFTFKREKIRNFVNLLQQSKIDLGLIEPRSNFEWMFQ